MKRLRNISVGWKRLNIGRVSRTRACIGTWPLSLTFRLDGFDFHAAPRLEIDAPSDVFRFSWQIKYSDKSPTFTTRGREYHSAVPTQREDIAGLTLREGFTA